MDNAFSNFKSLTNSELQTCCGGKRKQKSIAYQIGDAIGSLLGGIRHGLLDN